ncbi:maleylpyruvate isomerase N-terminal domain-containing protein [Actinomycetospora termitidis]|uniref:Maleylpyruvate isomerase N-terminal domain-containing protein n=1 Tax=Actinomycetospora termitidis TaxID=3053470 RepID=A0ABT7MAF5_9PSEU|nr:maleylpyruvate isomerase N-terminal domain-containing protein [Actinomycetospora sp. Odt1-22]MDL5157639.1 maleylpyruvate isomerase N-terminal domain-containing protein [Actinomycetospora sp. Odt1-22]
MNDETDAFLHACRAVGPDAVSACPGWTTREVAAHQAATCAEVVRHLEPYLAGEEVPVTRSFAEREAPYLRLDLDGLLDAVVEQEAAMQEAIRTTLAVEPDAVVPWTGRQMVVSTFRTHLRSEFALHRWDLTGDEEFLDAPELTDHALSVLGALLPRAGAAADSGDPLLVVLRSPGADDVVLEVGAAGTRLRRPDDDGRAPVGLELGAAARLLTLWGRRPAHRGVSHLPSGMLRRVQDLLAGY